jgi:hypothetical protein
VIHKMIRGHCYDHYFLADFENVMINTFE